MTTMITRWKAVRLLELVLFILALSGPWAYDRIDVPAEYACQKPYIRLYGDFCGLPITGLGILAGLSGEIVALIQRSISGTAASWEFTGMFLFAASVIVMLAPIASLVRRLVRQGGSWPWLHVSLSAIAITVAGILLTQPVSSPMRLWGVWLYAAMLLVLLVEGMVEMRTRRKNLPSA